MRVQNFQGLYYHYGHQVEVVMYGHRNIAIECDDCSEILLDFNEEG
jgi:hypothetical protein